MKNKPIVTVIIYGDNLDPQIITTTLRAGTHGVMEKRGKETQ